MSIVGASVAMLLSVYRIKNQPLSPLPPFPHRMEKGGENPSNRWFSPLSTTWGGGWGWGTLI
jgi:hypothetical protein